jgi:hypothetical protein
MIGYVAGVSDPSILCIASASQRYLICATRRSRILTQRDTLYFFGCFRSVTMFQCIIRLEDFASQLEICIGAIQIHFSVVGLLGYHLP